MAKSRKCLGAVLTFAAVALHFAPWVAGGVPQKSAGRIDGIVIDLESGTPLQGVRVQATGPSILSTPTAEDGRFAFNDLRPGLYRITTTSISHAPVRNSRQRLQGNSGVSIAVGPDELLSNIILRLAAWGVARGALLDANGQPLPNAVVIPARLGYDDSGRLLYQITPGMQPPQTTDDRGNFRFFELEPGEYYFAIEPQPALPTRAPQPYMQPVFYPGVTDPSQAVAFHVPAGVETYLGTITIPGKTHAAVRLRIVNQTGEVLRNRTVTLRSTVWNRVISSTGWGEPDPVGTSFMDLYVGMLGTHEIAVSWETGKGIAIGRARIDTTSGPPEADIVVRLGGRVSGIVQAERADGLEVLPNVDCRLSGQMVVPGRIHSSLYARTNADGNFSIDNIPQGLYRINCSGLPPTTYVAAVRQENRDVLPDGFAVEQDAELRILVRTGAVIHGRAVDAAGNSITDATVVLVPDASLPARDSLYRTATTDQHGSFALDAVPPGQYRVFAWMELPGPAYKNAEFMQRYEHLGKVLEVGIGGRIEEVVKILE